MDEDGEDGRYAVRRGGQLGDWAKIGWMAVRRSRRAPAVEFMQVSPSMSFASSRSDWAVRNGMMAVEHRKRIINRKARQKQVQQPEVRPKEIRQGDMKQTVNPTIANTKKLGDLLDDQPGNGKVNLFKWLINPRSFGQTVENTFWTSFLVTNGEAAIEVAEDGSGIPLICAFWWIRWNA